MNKLLMGLFGLAALPASANVIITEYVEGGGFNKAIEITNLGTTNVKLGEEGYSLSLYSNGGSEVKASVDLTGELPPNASLVIYNKGLTSAADFPAPIGLADSTVINHNGDDDYVLKKGDAIVDSIGQIGVDPGSFFGTDADNTKDHTLRRAASVTSGDTDPTDAYDPNSGEWVFFDKDTLDGLGCTGIAACAGDEPKPISEGDAPPVDTCIFTSCDDITNAKQRGDYVDATYYANTLAADATDTAAFINALHTDIKKDHQQLSYNQVWTAVIHTDEDPNNTDNVILLYTGKSVAKTENASVMGNAPDAWNREHVWSKSHGFPNSDQLGYTDIHHLRPADASINSLRSNYDFNDGGDVARDGDNATDNNIVSGESWEPRDQVKGDVARMMFYMDIRYQDGSDTDMPDLKLVDKVNTDGAEFGKLCALYQWHADDVVDAAEEERHNRIYEFQGNRNPFIDHPEWVETVYGSICDPQQVVMPTVTVSDTTVTEGDSVSLTANVNLDGLTFNWSVTSGETISLTGADSATVSFTAPDVDQATTVTLSVTVTDGSGNSAQANVNVMVEDSAVMPTVTVEAATANEGETVTLNATTNLEGLTFAWTVTSGEAISLTGADSASLSFTAPTVDQDTTLTLKVTVTDGSGNSAEAEVNVTVTNVPDPDPAPEEEDEGDDDSGGTTSPLVLLTLIAASLYRRKRMS